MKGKLFGLTVSAATAIQLIKPVFAADFDITPPSGFRITNIGRVISAGFALLLVVAGLLAFVFLLLGGLQWITSGGDKAGLEGARNKIVHAIVGLIVVFSAWALTLLLQNFVGYTFFGGFDVQRPF